MKRIHRLSLLEAQKIAAGQVVERPCNVIKELVENACDAGATQIAIHLEDGGKKRISVSDDGCGMCPEDARLSIEKHTTSKISSIADLAQLATFGFRGEALASMACVSTMKLITKQAHDTHALQLEICDGTIIQESVTTRNQGTTIEIENLFYNVPARYKFLKKRETEWTQIQLFLHAFCLSHHTIHMNVLHDGQQIMQYPAVDTLEKRCAQVWGPTTAQELLILEAEHESQAIKIHGVISHYQHTRYDRSGIFVFVNNRWIKNNTLIRALLKAYQQILVPGRYPIAAIFITLDPSKVDVNIHPRKEEVELLHQRTIEVLLQEAVTKALEQRLDRSPSRMPYLTPASVLPDGSIQRINYHTPASRYVPSAQTSHTSLGQAYTAVSTTPFAREPMFTKQLLYTNVLLNASVASSTPNSVTNDEIGQEERPVGAVIGQYALTYILIEHQDGLLLLDQHAAHERILYEQYVQCFSSVATVQLIVPDIITLAQDQITTLRPHLDMLRSHGFGIDIIAHDQLAVTITPVHTKNIQPKELILQWISWIHEYQSYAAQEFKDKVHHHLRAEMACKAAVKAGDKLSQQEMEHLVEQLEKTPNRLTCPHGRPTQWIISLYEFEKKFKRKK